MVVLQVVCCGSACVGAAQRTEDVRWEKNCVISFGGSVDMVGNSRLCSEASSSETCSGQFSGRGVTSTSAGVVALLRDLSCAGLSERGARVELDGGIWLRVSEGTV